MTATVPSPAYVPGSLVSARGREWVVLPPDPALPDVLMVRPLGGTDADATGILMPLEGGDVRPATFPTPTVDQIGDSVAAGLLRDAVRLNFRAGAGPFRSLGRIAVEPRAYQLVPLLMALRLEPVRLLIADDVGIGKTVEAALIARELLDRGEISRLAVLCPPHLCEQWQRELHDKFAIDAAVVRPGTIARLERDTGIRSIFEVYPFTVVSVDYIKSETRRHDFLTHCPEFVIVDEAHTCAAGASQTGGQHLRHELVKALAEQSDRHLVLTTATPHSGVEEAFRSLIALLDPDFENLPPAGDLKANDPLRQRLASHLVQRRRGDITDYLSVKTAFPERKTTEQTYVLSGEYLKLFQQVYAYATELVASGESLSRPQQRVRWWSALALLRCVVSSPAAAVAALRTRASTRPEEAQEGDLDLDAIDALGKQTVLDLDTSDVGEADDTVPAGDAIEDNASSGERARLQRMARDAEALFGAEDRKLLQAASILEGLLTEGFRPIVFCRYIATAKYLEEHLKPLLRKKKALADLEVVSVTGELPAEDRAERVAKLAESDRRILVATDCLSEGINLQEHFDSVFYYDLSWNPTRHEQRDGRVDRFGQDREEVRSVLYYGEDNGIDGLVMEVLLRKAQEIRQRLGVSVSVPTDTTKVMEAIAEGLLLRGRRDSRQLALRFEDSQRKLQEMDVVWNAVEDREKASRTIFAQRTIKPEEVGLELQAAAEALGNHVDTERFVLDACARLGAQASSEAPGRRQQGQTWRLPLAELPEPVLELGDFIQPGESRGKLKARRIGFELPLPEGSLHIPRTHPLVEALGSHVAGEALAGDPKAVAARCAAFRTDAVDTRTTVALLRVRMHLDVARRGGVASLLAEEAFPVAWRGRGADANFLSREEAEALLLAEPVGATSARERRIEEALEDLDLQRDRFADFAQEAADRALEAHLRVRRAAKLPTGGHVVRPVLPADVLGLYVLDRPAPNA